MRFAKTFLKLQTTKQAVFVVLAIVSLAGCSLIEDTLNDDEVNHCEPGRNTDMYWAQAIHFNSSEQRWVFHNWKGSGQDGGCDIHINIEDGQAAVPTLVRHAIESGAAQWRSVIEKTGLRCDTYLHFQSLGDQVVSVAPRIDIEFVQVLQGGDIAGSTVVTISDASRSFFHVLVQVAANLVVDGDTVGIPEPEYVMVITHELGHAFGIHGFSGASGHSDNPEDVMHATADCSILSAGDIETMEQVYSQPAYYQPAVSGAMQAADRGDARVLCRY